MLDLSLFLSAAALFDSISTTTQIVLVIVLLSTDTPVRHALGFIAGVSLAYLLCGLVSLPFLGQLIPWVKSFVPNLDALPDASYYLAQLLTGGALVAAGPAYALYRKVAKRPTLERQLAALLQRVNGWVVFGFGAFVSVASFPLALPYLASLAKIVATASPLPLQWGYVGYYNLVYALPMVVPFLAFLLLREGIVHRLHRHVDRLNTVLMVALLSGTGLLLVADAAWFFAGPGPLFANRFLLS